MLLLLFKSSIQEESSVASSSPPAPLPSAKSNTAASSPTTAPKAGKGGSAAAAIAATSPTHSYSFGYAIIGAMVGAVVGVMLHVAEVWSEHAAVCAAAGYGIGSAASFTFAELCSSNGPLLFSSIASFKWTQHVWIWGQGKEAASKLSRPIAAVSVVLHWACSFSDNCVVYQDAITSFLAAFVVTAMLAEHVKRKVAVTWQIMLQYVTLMTHPHDIDDSSLRFFW